MKEMGSELSGATGGEVTGESFGKRGDTLAQERSKKSFPPK